MYVLKQWLTAILSDVYSDYSSGTVTKAPAQGFYNAEWSKVNGSERLIGPGPVFERIANAMTTTIRRAAGPDLEVEGTALSV